MFGIFATIKIKPDQRDGFLGTIRETAFRSVSGEPGCVRFDVFQDLADEKPLHSLRGLYRRRSI